MDYLGWELKRQLGALGALLGGGRDSETLREGGTRRDTAERAAKKFSSDHVFDYLELTDDYGIYEIPLLREWIGKSIRELDFRVRYKVSILGIKTGEDLSLLPSPDDTFEREQHLMVIGKKKDIDRILQKM